MPGLLENWVTFTGGGEQLVIESTPQTASKHRYLKQGGELVEESNLEKVNLTLDKEGFYPISMDL